MSVNWWKVVFHLCHCVLCVFFVFFWLVGFVQMCERENFNCSVDFFFIWLAPCHNSQKSNNPWSTFPRLMNTRTDRLPATLWSMFRCGENVSVAWCESLLVVFLSVCGKFIFVFFNFTIKMYIALCCKTGGYDCKFIIKLTNLFCWLPLLMGRIISF